MPTVEGLEIDYKSRPFELQIETNGEVIIDKEDESGVFGRVPLRRAILPGIPEVVAVLARDEITQKLSQLMGWEERRLLTPYLEVGDKALEFMYLIDNQLLKAQIEEGKYRPVFFKHFETHDLNMPPVG